MRARKSHRLPWVWIYSGLAVLFLAIYVLKLGPFKETKKLSLRAPKAVLLEKKERDSIVADYVIFIAKDPMKMDIYHEFSNQALLKLSAAIKAMAKAIEVTLKVDLSVADEHSRKIIVSPSEASHSKDIKMSVSILTEALLSIQKEKYPSLKKEANAIRYAARSISAQLPALEQKKKIKIYFIRTAELLKKMN